jgi:hypothetical protein
VVGLKQQECRRGSCVVVVVSTVCVRVGCGGPDFLLFFLLSRSHSFLYIAELSSASSSSSCPSRLLPTKTWTSSEFLPFRKNKTKTKHNRPAFLGCFITPRQFLLFSTIQENSVAAQEWPRTGAKIATVRYDNSDIAAASAYGKMTMVRALPIYPLPYLSPIHPIRSIFI